MVAVTELKNWEKNPRFIQDKDFERLKEQLQTLGLYKPILTMTDGTVLGGNMRLRAYQDLAQTDPRFQNLWVSLIEFIQQDDGTFRAKVNGELQSQVFKTQEQGMLEYALSDNDKAGNWNPDELAELIHTYKDDISMDKYKADLAFPLTLTGFLDNYQPKTKVVVDENGNEKVVPVEEEFDNANEVDERLETYENGSIRQIVLYFNKEEYQQILPKLEQIMKEQHFENNTEVFLFLLNHYESTRPPTQKPRPETV